MKAIYVASGWWLPGHLDALGQLEKHLSKNGHGFFSPRLSEPQISPESTPAVRNLVFRRNLQELRECRMVFARIDDWDPGTVWEMGFAFAHAKPVVAWSLVPGRKLNLMLSESCDGFVNGFEKTMQLFQPGGKINWEVALKWQAEVE